MDYKDSEEAQKSEFLPRKLPKQRKILLGLILKEKHREMFQLDYVIGTGIHITRICKVVTYRRIMKTELPSPPCSSLFLSLLCFKSSI